MTDPHDNDELLRNRIRDAVRHLNGVSTGLESDEDIAAQLDAVSAAPLNEDEVMRVMNKVNRDLRQTAGDEEASDSGRRQPNTSSSQASQEDVPMQKRHSSSAYVRPVVRSRGSSSVAVIVTASACLLAAVGLLQVSQQPESPEVVDAKPPVLEQIAATGSDLQPRLMANSRNELTPAASMRIGETLSTGERERRRVGLPDGSVLFINEQTSVTVESDRRLKLNHGEVFVEVVPAELADGNRFIVKTPNRAVTALGTKFAVNAASSETGVLVTQGKVAVSGVGPLVRAGQEVVLDDRIQPAPLDVVESAPRASEALGWTRELMASVAPVLVPKSDHAGGSIVVVDPDGQEMRLSLRRFDVDVHIQDGFARTTIDQTYFNHTFSRQEGTFHFPLPPDASLSRLAMYVNGKLMEGGMAERQRARDVYEQIRHTRRDPALLEWVDGSTFKMRVFPLEARQEKRIVLSYTQRLANDYDRTVYRFPAGHSMERVGDWTAKVRVDGGSAKATKQKWFSPSHLLKATEDEGDLVLEGELTNAALDKDLVVELQPNNKDIRRGQRRSVRFSSMQHEGFEYLMLRYRPDLTGELNRPKRNWVFLFESSGDRNPLLARTQIEVIRTLLDNAEHDDTFSIISAATRSEAFRDKPVKCSSKNIKAAIAHLEEAHLVGALDLGRAFEASRELCDNDGESWLVHVGSATPTVGERDAKKLLKKLPKDTTYCGVGVGKRWDRAFMKVAAAQSGGHFTQINPDEKVAWRAFELFSTLNAPRLLEIDVRSEKKNPRWLCFAETIAHGQEIAAVTRVPASGEVPTSLTVTGVLDGEEFEQAIEIADVEGEAGYLPRIWARQEIDRLVAAGAEKHKAEIIVLSKAMYVMSPFTSLLVLEDKAMYQQFAIDRGRKDHWALYPAPEQIEVVYEPGTTFGQRDEPIEILRRQLKAVRAERDVVRANHTIGVQDSQPVERIRQLQSELEEKEEAIKRLETTIARVEAVTESEVTKAVTSVLARGRSNEVPRSRETVVLNRLLVSPDALRWGGVQHDVEFAKRRFMEWSIIDSFNSHLPELLGEDEMSAIQLFDSSNSMNMWGVQPLKGVMFLNDSNGNGPVDTESLHTFWYSNGGMMGGGFGGFGGGGGGAIDILGGGVTVYDSGLGTRDLRTRLRQLNELHAIRGGLVEDRIRDFEMAYRMQGVDNWATTWSRNGVTRLHSGLGPQVGFRQFALPQLTPEFMPATRLSLIDLQPEVNWDWRETDAPVRQRIAELQEVQKFLAADFIDLDGDSMLSEVEELGLIITRGQEVSREMLVPSYDVSDLILSANSGRGIALTADGRYLSVNPPDIDIDGIMPFGTIMQPTVRYIARPDGSQIPVVVAPRSVISDPVSYAPGMESSTADLLSVLQREAPDAVSVEAGKVDRGARKLIERSRKRGWEEVRISSEDEGNEVTVLVNGSGQYAYTRKLHEGLTEQVVCDGDGLWHLYPDLGIGARREVTRFHRQTLRRLVPWFVDSADDLAIGANIELVDSNTIRIIPIRKDDKETKKKKRDRLVIELIFDGDARLVERRIINVDDDDAIVHRLAFLSDGTITVFAGASRQSETINTLARGTAEAPSLKPQIDGLVVLPLPYRSAESYEVDAPVETDEGAADYSKISEADAMKLIATHFANRDAAAMWQVIRSRFFVNGDARIGFATLLASANAQDTTPIHELASQPVVVDGVQSGTATGTPKTLGNYLVQWSDWHRNRDLNREFIVPEGTSPFLQTLAEAHNVYARWASGRATHDRTRPQIRTEFRRALALIRKLKSPGVAWRLLKSIDQRFEINTITDAAYYDELAKEAKRFEEFAGFYGRARLSRIDWLLTGGRKEQAEELYADFLDSVAELGIAPPLHTSLYSAFADQFGEKSPWQKLVRHAGRKLAEKDRPAALIALAVQCLRNSETELGRSLFETAIEDVDLAEEPGLALIGLRYAWDASEWSEAEKCLQALLQDDKRSRIAPLWRRASEIAASLGDEDESMRRMEQALELEFSSLPDMVDIAKFREQYSLLLARMESFAQERVIAGEQLPHEFVGRMIRIADRWRSIDPDTTASCQAAARILDIIGDHGLAWDYWTTPLAATPNESSAWTALARALRDRSRIVEADKAFTEAFACEQTNADILIERADMLLLDGQRRKAMEVYEQISKGNWQPRFSGTKSRAAAALQAVDETKE